MRLSNDRILVIGAGRLMQALAELIARAGLRRPPEGQARP